LWAGQVTQATTCVRNGNGCASCDLADDDAIGSAARHPAAHKALGLTISPPILERRQDDRAGSSAMSALARLNSSKGVTHDDRSSSGHGS